MSGNGSLRLMVRGRRRRPKSSPVITVIAVSKRRFSKNGSGVSRAGVKLSTFRIQVIFDGFPMIHARPSKKAAYRTVHKRNEGLSSQGQLRFEAASGPLTSAGDGVKEGWSIQIEDTVI